MEQPADPEEWTDEQWIEWLKATDDVDPDEPDADVYKVMSRIVRSTPGQVVGQAMLGMAQAIYGRRDDEVVIVSEANGEPADDEEFAVRLDPEHPERSAVVFQREPKRPN